MTGRARVSEQEHIVAAKDANATRGSTISAQTQHVGAFAVTMRCSGLIKVQKSVREAPEGSTGWSETKP